MPCSAVAPAALCPANTRAACYAPLTARTSGRIWPSNTSVTLLKTRGSRVVGKAVMRSTPCCSCSALSVTTGALAGQSLGTAATASTACSEAEWSGSGSELGERASRRSGGGGTAGRRPSVPSSSAPRRAPLAATGAFPAPEARSEGRRGPQREEPASSEAWGALSWSGVFGASVVACCACRELWVAKQSAEHRGRPSWLLGRSPALGKPRSKQAARRSEHNKG